MLLYVMSTADTFKDLMYRMMDSTVTGAAPERNDFSSAAVFSVLWMLVGGFFALNLFVGVVVDSFNRIKEDSDLAGGSATMTVEQKQWVDMMKTVMKEKPPRVVRPPRNPVRNRLFKIVTAPLFDHVILSAIFANVLVMSTYYLGIEDNQPRFLLYTWSLIVLTHVFYFEALLKIVGLGCGGYFCDAWCRFECYVIAT